MEAFLKDGHPLLGTLPGPLVLASCDEAIWAAGGGYGDSRVLRFEADGWRSWPTRARGLRAVLPLSGHAAVIAGEYGFLAIIDIAAGGDESISVVETQLKGCLYGLTRAGDLVWVTGDDGFVATLHPQAGELRTLPPLTSGRVVRAVAAPGGQLSFVTDRQLLMSLADGTTAPVLSGRAPLTGVAYAPDGCFAVTGDEGQLFLAAPGQPPVPCGGVPSLDLECVSYDAGRDGFLIAGDRGFTGVLGRDGQLRTLPAAAPPYRLTSILAWGDGHLYAGWTRQGPPYVFRSALYFDGDKAPRAVYQAPRQDFGPPRERTVGRSGRPPLPVGAFEVITLEEALRRLPDIQWENPGFEFGEVRFYDGDVHVTGTGELLEDHTEAGYAIAIRGDLIVDGTLDASAGGDGYGSLLAVQGDVWARAARFSYAIVAQISGALEVETVIVCDHGDDGGDLKAGKIRAQVLHYSLYFPKPEAEIDAFCVGNVYGDESFPPGRGSEIFVPGVLADGELDEDAAADWLREGRPILRDA
jgi:hypothetical protein